MSKKKLRPCGQDFSCLFLSALKTYKSILKPKLKSQMKNIFNQKVVLSFLLLFSLTLTTSLAQTEDVVIVDSDFSNKGGLIASLPINRCFDRNQNVQQLGPNIQAGPGRESKCEKHTSFCTIYGCIHQFRRAAIQCRNHSKAISPDGLSNPQPHYGVCVLLLFG